MQHAKVKAVFVSFETLRKPKDADIFVPAWKMEGRRWQSEVLGHLKAEPGQRTWHLFWREIFIG